HPKPLRTEHHLSGCPDSPVRGEGCAGQAVPGGPRDFALDAGGSGHLYSQPRGIPERPERGRILRNQEADQPRKTGQAAAMRRARQRYAAQEGFRGTEPTDTAAEATKGLQPGSETKGPVLG